MYYVVVKVTVWGVRREEEGKGDWVKYSTW